MTRPSPDQHVALNAATAGPQAGDYRLNSPIALAADDFEHDRAKGLIRNVTIMTIGPATGHGFEIDARTLETLIEVFEANKDRVVARVTHPENDFTGGSDGIEWLVGVPHNLRIEGDKVKGDIRFLKAAKRGPNGNLWDYTFDLVEEEPQRIGLSAVGRFDFEQQVDDQTGETVAFLGRMKFLKAVDFVNDPAANRNGLLAAQPQNTPDATGGSPLEKDMRITARLRNFLESKGLAKGASDDEARALILTLSQADQAKCQTLSADDSPLEGDDGQGDTGGEGDTGTAGGDTTLNTPSTDPAPTNQGVGLQSPASQAQPTAPANSPDVQTAVNEALATERHRHLAICNLADEFNLGTQWAQGQINLGHTLAQAQTAALAQLRTSMAPVAGLNIRAGDDGRESLCAAIEDAFALRTEGASDLYETLANGRPKRNSDGTPVVRDPHERVHEFEHLRLVDIGRRWLQTLGVADAGFMPEQQVARLCCNRLELMTSGLVGGVALSHATGDFPKILENTLHKVLLPAYEEEESTHEQWTVNRVVRDFRAVKINQLGRIVTLRKVLEGEEYEYGFVGEKQEQVQAVKYGILLFMTWEMFINDDLGAFTEQAFGFSQSAHRLENDLVYAQITSNPTMTEDSVALFHQVTHNNLNMGGGAAALSKTTLKDMRVPMRKQKGIESKSGKADGATLNLRPNTLLVPIELEVEAEQLLSSLVELGVNNNAPNYRFLRSLTPISETRLSDDSTTAHYLVAGKNRSAPAMVTARLRGNERPTVERLTTGSSVDGTTWKARHVFGVAPGDWRAWQKNDGA